MSASDCNGQRKTMKKILFLLGILATVAGVFSSCENEDEGDNNTVDNVTKQRKLLVATQQVLCYDNNRIVEYRCKYDSNGKLIDRYSPESDTVEGTLFDHKYSLSSGEIISSATEFNPDGSIGSTTTTSTKDTFTSVSKKVFKYDENRHLVSESEYNVLTGEPNENYMYQWVWENGNIIKFIQPISQGRKGEWLYEYTNDEVTTPLENKTDVLFFGYGGNLTYINRYGVAGKNLPVAMINGASGGRQRIDWTLDKDGYPIRVEFCWADKDGKPSYDKSNNKDMIATMDFFWE